MKLDSNQNEKQRLEIRIKMFTISECIYSISFNSLFGIWLHIKHYLQYTSVQASVSLKGYT